MRTIVGSAALAVLLAASGSWQAETVVKQEPFEGQMLPGAVILVDDGTCGKGKIKEVAGKVLGDAKLESEGKADKAAGKIQNAVGGVKDTLRGK